ncbi:hypothetical protein LTR10_022095 [Elasticomyces elasticus]|uniref:Uncharacterized protein n=1 Tax=Exophiala sideris TaxID=1016849 RepID=A0ABR0IVV3_9EURO|nr:hypothetical protein LTR10_022095 [Elasticomyces elasticus]KAK5021459.1 hypothetical protein LTS07_010968 [Exophiala sideris]KAK5024517.1 hypothetical protein LTR13_010878 [Exophiala sideris]KAK5049591.1 hypothetical protein LTR69_010992 [Exophiala sideris]KAK5176614.1 hypothetical protein LTR44_010900 [Eurotiomycetes sp. CCFEE 6388]
MAMKAAAETSSQPHLAMALLFLTPLLALLSACTARPGYDHDAKPYAAAIQARQTTANSSSSLQVDLGYEIYQGTFNSTSGLNLWKG